MLLVKYLPFKTQFVCEASGSLRLQARKVQHTSSRFLLSMAW